MTYTVPASVNVNRPVTWSNWGDTGSGWYDVELPPGGDWVEARPENLPDPTTPFGTVQFQATLSWTNTESSSADLDLHLFGPDDLHVYYGDTYESGDPFQLDRDWQGALGNAIENIYSVETNLPRGNYRVMVKHYYGSLPKSYTIRVITGGTVRSYSKRMTSYD